MPWRHERTSPFRLVAPTTGPCRLPVPMTEDSLAGDERWDGTRGYRYIAVLRCRSSEDADHLLYMHIARWKLHPPLSLSDTPLAYSNWPHHSPSTRQPMRQCEAGARKIETATSASGIQRFSCQLSGSLKPRHGCVVSEPASLVITGFCGHAGSRT